MPESYIPEHRLDPMPIPILKFQFLRSYTMPMAPSMSPAATVAWLALVSSAAASVGVPASPRVWSELVSGGNVCDVTR